MSFLGYLAFLFIVVLCWNAWLNVPQCDPGFYPALSYPKFWICAQGYDPPKRSKK